MSDTFLPGSGFDTYEEQDKVLVGLCGGRGCRAAVRILQQQGFAVAGAVVRLTDADDTVQAAKDALAALESAVTALEDRTLDCAALDLRAAWEALGAITGESATEDVIDRIFEKFCLGK